MKLLTKEQLKRGWAITTGVCWMVICLLFFVSLCFDVYNKASDDKTTAFTTQEFDDEAAGVYVPPLTCIRRVEKGLSSIWCTQTELINVK